MPQYMTPEEELGRWEELFAEFRRTTPGAPDWFTMVDICVRTLVSQKISDLRSSIAEEA